MVNKDDYSERLRKRLDEIMPNETVKAILKSSSRQDTIPAYLVNLRNSIIKLTNDKEYANSLVSKLDNIYVFEGFVNDLIRRGKVGFDESGMKDERKKADETVEYYTSLRCDSVDAINNKFKKEQFQRGMSLAQQSEI